MSRIVVDVMGSDLGVREVVVGVAQISMEPENTIHMILVGDALQIAEAFIGLVYHPRFIEVVHAENYLRQEDKPQQGLSEQSDLSIVKSCELVQAGQADALVSAGNTGGVMLSCSRHFNRIVGVRKVALAAVLPTEKRRGSKEDPFALLLDVGATLHVESGDLVAFGVMGSEYARIVSGNENPSVALLSNGSESSKGGS